jgi:hypothetical protein
MEDFLMDLTLVQAVIIDIWPRLVSQGEEMLVEVVVDGFQCAVETTLIGRAGLVDGDEAEAVVVKAFGYRVVRFDRHRMMFTKRAVDSGAGVRLDPIFVG